MTKQQLKSWARSRWGALFKLLLPALVLVGCLFTAKDALASHFRHGQISWFVPDPVNAPRTVRFTVTTTWRTGATDGTTLNFGDGTNNGFVTGATIGTGSDSTGQGYVVTEYTATKTYATNGPFTAFFESCCRIGGGATGLQNGANGNFRVQAVVNLNASNSAPGLIASRPRSAASAPPPSRGWRERPRSRPQGGSSPRSRALATCAR
jgi:hypothetical protein